MAEVLVPLQQFVAALGAGDRAAAVGCFGDRATLTLPHADTVATGRAGIDEAVGALLGGFRALRYETRRRYVAAGETIEEATLSGEHHGEFAGAWPVGGVPRPVVVDVRLAARADGGALESLTVWVDVPTLRLQLGLDTTATAEVDAVASTYRHEHSDGVVVIEAPPEVEPAAPHRAPRRRRRVVAGAVIVAGACAAAIGAAAMGHAGGSSAVGRPTTGGNVSRSPVAATTPLPTPSPSGGRVPAIATPQPSARPTVQPGRQVVLSADVLFAFDSARLNSAARATIRRVAGQIRAQRVHGVVQVNGYTDNVGTAAYDRALSRARALAVAKVLQAALTGVPVTLAPQGFGAADPVADNGTAVGQARNRRVTIVLPTR